MAKDIASYFLEEGQPIVPKPKPKQYLKSLNALNTKAAVNTLSPKTYTNLVGQISRKAFDNKEISASDYYDTVMPLFGETGEMVTEKIKQYDAELDRYADGGRVNFGIGAGGSDPKTGQGFQKGNTGFRTKDGEVRNVKGKNQHDPLRTLEKVQKAIDDAPPITIKGKTFERNPKDLMADSSYVNKKEGGTQYITRKEFDKYKDKLKFKAKGPKNFGEETRKKAADKRRDFTKTRSSESLEKALAAPRKSGLNFHHAGFKESLTDLKNTMYIPGSPNRKMAKLFEDPLLKQMETFTKVFDDIDASALEKQKAATNYLKNDRALRQKYPEFKDFKTRLSFRRTAFEPGIMFKEKLPDPSLAISNEPGMTLKGETSKSPRGKEIIKKAAEKYGKFAKAIAFKPVKGLVENYKKIRPGIDKATQMFPGKADNAIAAAIDFPMMYMSGAPALEAAGSAASMFINKPNVGKAVNLALESSALSDEEKFLKRGTDRREGIESMLQSIPSRFKETINQAKGIRDETEEYIP